MVLAINRAEEPEEHRIEPAGLHPAEEQENQEDEYDQAQATTGKIAPATTVVPAGKCSDSHEQQDYKKNGDHVDSLLASACSKIRENKFLNGDH